MGETDAGVWPSTDGRAELSRLGPGRQVKAPAVLFKKIEDAQVAEWIERFGGGKLNVPSRAASHPLSSWPQRSVEPEPRSSRC